MKNGPLDMAVCPSCGAFITREQMLEVFRRNRIDVFVCDCRYEFNMAPYRPLTIAEMLRGRESEGEYANVNLETYTRKILEIFEAMKASR